MLNSIIFLNYNEDVLFLSNVVKSKRIFYFDALRAMAIFAVIIFHLFNDVNGLILNEYNILSFNWIFTDIMGTCFRFGVDLFLMLSGALSLGRVWDIKSFLGKRIPRIVAPFLFWGFILTLILFLISSYFPDFINLFDSYDLIGFLTYLYQAYLAKTPGFYQYWFFWMILGTYLIMPIFNKWLFNADLKEAEYFLVIWLITCIFDYTLNIECPVKLSYFSGPIGMVVLGYYLRHTKRKIFNNPYVAILITVISVLLLVYISYLNSTVESIYIFERYNILIAIEVTGVFLLFKNFSKFNFKNRLLTSNESIFRKIIFSIAKYSYGIYLVHRVILVLAYKLLYDILPYKILVITLFISAVCISWFILAILNRIPYINQVIGAK